MRNRPIAWVALMAAAWIVSACTIPVQIDHADMPGMDHEQMPEMHQEQMSSMEHDEMMSMEDPELFDAQFIDGMIEHHQGAVTMAEQVLIHSDRPELHTLATEIIAAQTREIEEMENWRADWYPNLETTEGMHMDMGAMEISPDESVPFDQRFLEAMISHHIGAVVMAEMALQISTREEIRTLAETIIADQNAEIDLMRGWLQEWYAIEE